MPCITDFQLKILKLYFTGLVSVQPANNKDFLGIDYMQEIMKSNPLKKLTQLHLYSRDGRSKKFLDKNCAEFLLRHFGSLKHFGTFKHWKLSRSERTDIVTQAVKENRQLSFDESIRANSRNTEAVDIRNRSVTLMIFWCYAKLRICC